ncbi:MAG: hypothetical protein KatS3mg027_0862 [Bacteroidia bacterium]|nr:MAG: hypothetical protein KatS3mg027_0862 [Bacteroidia bacterium]
MIYIILATITSVLMLVIVRLFEIYNAHTFYGLIFNYISAFLTGLIYSYFYFQNQYLDFFQAILSNSWNVWILTAVEGVLFISVFYWIAMTIKHYGMAVASVANKMSLIFPVISAYWLFNEYLNAYRWVGLVIAILSVYLTTYSSKKFSFSKTSYTLFPLLVFIGSGIIDSLINYGNKTFIDTIPEQLLFSTFVYLFALFTGFLLLKLDKNKFLQQQNFSWKHTMMLGFILGIPNFYNLVFIIKALNTHVLPSGQIFLILNLSNVISSSIIGYLIFKEKINKMNWLGILLAISSILLIQH